GERRLDATGEGIPEAVFSSDARYLAVSDKKSLRVFDLATGKTEATLPWTGREYWNTSTSLTFARDNQFVVEGSNTGKIVAVDWRAGKTVFTKALAEGTGRENHVFDLQPLPSAPDRVLFTRWDNVVQDLDLTTQKVTGRPSAAGSTDLHRGQISPDGTLLAQSDSGNTIVISRLETGKPVARLAGHTSTVKEMRFTPDGRLLVSRSDDSTTRVWDITKQKEVLGYVLAQADDELSSRPPEWIAYTPNGYFEASEGANKLVHFARGMHVFEADQFYEQFYRSGLTRSVFAGSGGMDSGKGGSLSDALKNGVPPTVKLRVPTSAASNSPTVEITVEATEQAGGGVKAIRLYHNDRLVGGPAVLRGIAVEAVAGQTTTKKFTVPLATGENSFRAVAYSKTDLESKPATATIAYAPAQVRKPTLHLLSVGVNRYQDATMNLAYAQPDAMAIADFFEKGGAESTLFGKVNVVRLFDADATGKAILDSLAALAKTSAADDVVFVYLAGHGETAGGVWHFLPAEMRQMALPERVTELGIPWPKVEDAIGKINARKVVLVVDACKSGAALGAKTRGTDDSQQT
ncbi:MAG: caspase family protein, partial [Armatimonadota bacterium]